MKEYLSYRVLYWLSIVLLLPLTACEELEDGLFSDREQTFTDSEIESLTGTFYVKEDCNGSIFGYETTIAGSQDAVTITNLYGTGIVLRNGRFTRENEDEIKIIFPAISYTDENGNTFRVSLIVRPGGSASDVRLEYSFPSGDGGRGDTGSFNQGLLCEGLGDRRLNVTPPERDIEIRMGSSCGEFGNGRLLIEPRSSAFPTAFAPYVRVQYISLDGETKLRFYAEPQNATTYTIPRQRAFVSDGGSSTADFLSGIISLSNNSGGEMRIDLENRNKTCRFFESVDPPEARFSLRCEGNCEAPATVSFSNNSLNATSYQWDFGDGNTSTATNPTHTYQSGGTYTVSLTARGANGSTDRTTRQLDVGIPNSTALTLVVENQLTQAIVLRDQNDNVIGSVPARSNARFTLDNTNLSELGWINEAVILNDGKVLGQYIGGFFTYNEPPTGEIGVTIDNLVGESTYQNLLLTNASVHDLYWDVNIGTNSAYTSETWFMGPAEGIYDLGYYASLDIDEDLHLHRSDTRDENYYWVRWGNDMLGEGSGTVFIAIDISDDWVNGTITTDFGRSKQGIELTPTFLTPMLPAMSHADFSNCDAVYRNDKPLSPETLERVAQQSRTRQTSSSTTKLQRN